MDLWDKMIFPVRGVWIAFSARVKARKNGGGLLKLHNDVQTCDYQDVQVMWEMLRRSESELMNISGHQSHIPTKRKLPRPFWRVHASSSSSHKNI